MTLHFISFDLEISINSRLTCAQLFNSLAAPLASLRITTSSKSPEWLRLTLKADDIVLGKKRVNNLQAGDVENIDVEKWILPVNFPMPENSNREIDMCLFLEGCNKQSYVHHFSVTLASRNTVCTLEDQVHLICAHVAPECEQLRAFTSEAAGTAGSDTRSVMRGIYELVRTRRLPYQNVAMITEPGYQTVYNPLHVMQYGGSCADMSLMFASLFRTAGLYPVLFMFNDHMIAGCWTTPAHFASAAIMDRSVILEQIDSGRLLAVECTAACGNVDNDFDTACTVASALLHQPDRRLTALDVWQALSTNVRSLPLPEPKAESPARESTAVVRSCPHCGYTHFSPEEFDQENVYCPACGVTFTPKREPKPVPKPDPENAAPEGVGEGTLPPSPIRINATEMICSMRGSAAVVTGGSKKAPRLAVRPQFQGRPVTVIAPNALSGAVVEEVFFADTIRTIGDRAFYRCASLQAVELPPMLETLGMDAFQNCTSMTRAVIPGTLKRISRMSFRGCSALKEVVLSEGTEIVDSYAFCGCTSLETITIPASVREIKDKAFADCTSLREVRLMSDSTRVSPTAFSGCKLL